MPRLIAKAGLTMGNFWKRWRIEEDLREAR
jgi:hypothetical protein